MDHVDHVDHEKGRRVSEPMTLRKENRVNRSHLHRLTKITSNIDLPLDWYVILRACDLWELSTCSKQKFCRVCQLGKTAFRELLVRVLK